MSTREDKKKQYVDRTTFNRSIARFIDNLRELRKKKKNRWPPGRLTSNKNINIFINFVTLVPTFTK